MILPPLVFPGITIYTLAYFSAAAVTKKKSLMTLTAEVLVFHKFINFIKFLQLGSVFSDWKKNNLASAIKLFTAAKSTL